MTHIQILGAGCQKCEKLYEHADQAARELGLEYDILKVTDLDTILGFGVLTTPALVVDGTVKSAGRVPSAEQLKALLR
jgi:small redox-active disulfide protein 2